MKVRITQAVVEKDKDGNVVGVKSSRRASKFEQVVGPGGNLETREVLGKQTLFIPGAVIEMSETSARKYAEKGWGEIVGEDDERAERDRKAAANDGGKSERQ